MLQNVSVFNKQLTLGKSVSILNIITILDIQEEQ
jgi:hypothetical protein